MLHRTSDVLGGMPTHDTSVAVSLLTSPSRTQHTRSVLQWLASKYDS